LTDHPVQAAILDVVMRPLAPQRRKALARAHGEVLEIGVGTGLNLPLYGPAVRRVRAVEPDGAMLRRARPRAEALPLPIEIVQGTAEALPADDASVDCVVGTWVLCTIPDPVRALVEVRRVLKPGGTYVFAEHVRSETRALAALQHALTPCWRCAAGGCELDRDTLGALQRAGFADLELHPPRARWWSPIPSWWGVARQP
jgi:ubiquinone/menaquinone biosynthesis C-methylase UbiE